MWTPALGRVKAIPIKFPEVFWMEPDKLIPKFIRRHKEPRRVRRPWRGRYELAVQLQVGDWGPAPGPGPTGVPGSRVQGEDSRPAEVLESRTAAGKGGPGLSAEQSTERRDRRWGRREGPQETQTTGDSWERSALCRHWLPRVQAGFAWTQHRASGRSHGTTQQISRPARTGTPRTGSANSSKLHSYQENVTKTTRSAAHTQGWHRDQHVLLVGTATQRRQHLLPC